MRRSFVDGRQGDGGIENAGGGPYCRVDGNKSRPNSNTICWCGIKTAAAGTDVDGWIANIQKSVESRGIVGFFGYHRPFDAHQRGRAIS